MTIDVERRGHVCYLTINRPKVFNALDLATLDALADAWREVDENPDIRVAVITGAGEKAFSVGADLKSFAPPGTKIDLAHPAFFPETNKPIIAAVNGHCLAGGTELLGATDIRIAAEHALFGITEPRVGLFPAGGSAVRFPRQLPWPLAMELMITGRHIPADEALRWGLIGRVVSGGELMTAAEETAQNVAKLAPVSVQAIKECAQTTAGMPLAEAFVAQVAYTRRVMQSEDAREGPRAFLEKREPKFEGR